MKIKSKNKDNKKKTDKNITNINTLNMDINLPI